MKSRVLFALIAAALLLAGCSSNNNNEWQRVVCSVQSINDGAPVVSAAVNTGADAANTTDDYVPLDFVNVLFWARPYGSMMTIPTNGAYSSFIITGYDAVWEPGPNAPAAITDYNVERGALSARVPINDEIEVAFVIAGQEMKQEAWYPAQYSSTVFTANLHLTFYGHEEGSEHEVAIPAGATVTFLGAVGQNN